MEKLDRFEEDTAAYFHEPCIRCINRFHKQGSVDYIKTCGQCVHL